MQSLHTRLLYWHALINTIFRQKWIFNQQNQIVLISTSFYGQVKSNGEKIPKIQTSVGKPWFYALERASLCTAFVILNTVYVTFAFISTFFAPIIELRTISWRRTLTVHEIINFQQRDLKNVNIIIMLCMSKREKLI